MSDKRKISALSRKDVIIPAYSVATVEYMDTRPNYFRVQNSGAVNIYCGASHIPTARQFDFMVPAEGTRMFAEPYNRSRLYLFNPSGTDIQAVVLSFTAEFDPLALALSELSFDFSDLAIEASTVITGFSSPLPSGSNFIGNVSVTNPLPQGTNLIGVVGLQSAVTDALTALRNGQKDYSQALADILEAIGNIEGSGGGSSATSETLYFWSYQGTAETAGQELINDFVVIHTISNDGESDMSVSLQNAGDSSLFTITLKAGETLNDLQGLFSKVTVSGSGVPFRLWASIRK